jgi:transposase
VPVKSVEQQALTGLHRLRSSWVAARTARLNTMRGLLREIGATIPAGARQVVPAVWQLISDAESELPEPLRPALAEAAREVVEFERRIAEVEAQLEGLARSSPVVRRLRTIPGVLRHRVCKSGGERRAAYTPG